MTNEVKNVPELRFPEFNKEWELHYLNEILEVKSGKDYKHLEKGEYPVYGTGGYMLSVSDFLYEEEAIGIGRKGTINKPYLLNGPFWTVDTLFYCVPKKNTDVQFLLNVFKTINWKIYDESTGVPSLSKVTINKINKRVPEYNEQKKIGDFFILFDRKIEIEEQKLEKLEQQKKGYMQKIFSQELRFKDENGKLYTDWEKKLLKNIAEVKTGSKNVQDNIVGGKYKFFDRSVDVKYLNTYDFDETAIIYPGEGSKFLPRFFEGKYSLHQRAYSIYNIELDPTYLYTYLLLQNNHFLKYAVGSTVKSLRMIAFDKLKVMIPNAKEQKKLGDFFNKLDSFIEKQSDKVELLKERKRGFLQKMFV